MNGFVTDVDYFRKNRNIFKFSTLILIFALFVPSVVYSQPDNEIELPAATSNVDYENGIVKKYQVHNGLYKDSLTGNIKYYPIRKGKHHKKSSKIKARKFLDPNKQYFDYYPVEKVDLKYDSKEDDNIDVILLSDQEKFKMNLTKLLNNNDNNKKRLKRDLTNLEEEKENNNNNENNDKNLVKRQNGYIYETPAVTPTYEREYYAQGTKNDPWNNEFNSRTLANLAKQENNIIIKYSIPGNYYNAISPSGYYLPVETSATGDSNDPFSITNRGSFVDDRPIWNRIPIRGTQSQNKNNNNNNGRDNCNCDGQTQGNQNPNELPSTIDRNPSRPVNNNPSRPVNKNPSPPLIHVAMPNGSPQDFRTRFDSDFEVRDRVVWDRIPPRVNFERPSHREPSPPLIHEAKSNRIADDDSVPDNDFRIPSTDIKPKEPSKCVWAIVSCCARNDINVRYACFEEIGCHGAFWDINPCADEYQRKALAQAGTFFGQ